MPGSQGAPSLLEPRLLLQALGLVRHGVTVSLARDISLSRPSEHFSGTTTVLPRPGGSGSVLVDDWRIRYHGQAITHVDALCHVWVDDELYGGVPLGSALRPWGSTQGDVALWRNGIFGRGILLDVCRHRDVPFVTPDRPVTGGELAEIAAALPARPAPGDILVVHCGRDEYEAEFGGLENADPRPGLDFSCREFLREVQPSALVWDMGDTAPKPADHPWGVHAAIHELGLALVDNASLAELVTACRTLGADQFLVVVLPLPVEGASGSPVNPVAVL